MKKICFVATLYTTYKDFLKSFSEYLYETGEYDISLICNADPEIENDKPSFVHYYSVRMERGISLTAFTAIKSIERILKKEKFDIVQYSTPNAAFYTSIAARKAEVPVRLYCQWGIRYMGFEGWQRKLFKLLEKMTCENSTFIEAESHNIRRFSLKENLYTANRSCVIWNGSASGVDLSKFNLFYREKWRQSIRKKFNWSTNDTVFAFAGRLTADKGVNELLEAFYMLTQKFDNVKLMVIGRMDNNASLDAGLMRWAKESIQVVFTGKVDDIERYYAAADVFVAPSYREGFGLVVIEAEAMGLPAIVSDVPGQIDAIIPDKTGITCAVKDSDSLRAAMQKMLDNSDMRRKLGGAAAEYVETNYEQKKLFSYLKQHRDELIG